MTNSESNIGKLINAYSLWKKEDLPEFITKSPYYPKDTKPWIKEYSHTTCQERLNWFKEKSKKGNQLFEEIVNLSKNNNSNQSLIFDSFFECIRCRHPGVGAYNRESKTVQICENNAPAFKGKDYFEKFLIHELIHAVDDQNEKFPKKFIDFFENLEKTKNFKNEKEEQQYYREIREELDNECLAITCSEIRASHLSGQCDWSPLKLNFPSQKNFEKCVRKQVEDSLNLHLHCRNEKKKWISEKWKSCFNDKSPFENI